MFFSKSIAWPVIAMLTLSASFALTSCGGDDDDNNDLPNIPSDYNPSTPGQTDDVKAIVAKHVSVDATYGNYMMTFIIHSSLNAVYPGQQIYFGVSHGLTTFRDETPVSVGYDAYEYESSGYSETMTTVTIKNPFWFYYIWGERDDEKAVSCQTYYEIYKALRYETSLTEGQREMLDEAIEYLDDCEREARRYYRPGVEVQIGNKFYNVGKYSF